MTIVHAIDEGLALLGGEDVGRVGQRLDEPLRRLVGQPHLGLADLLQGGAVDGGAAELRAEGLPVFLVLLPEAEQVVDGAGHDGVDAMSLSAHLAAVCRCSLAAWGFIS